MAISPRHSHFDRDEIRRKVLLRLFGHPLGVVPMALGASVMLTPLLFSVEPAFPIFAGICGMVLGGASIAVRTLLGREAITRRVIEELEADVAKKARMKLMALRKRLAADKDPRDEQLLDDLIRLVQAIRDDDLWRKHVDVVVAADILADLEELTERSLSTLERALVLEQTAIQLHSANAREGLRTERERLLGEVQSTVDSVSQLLTQLKVLGATSGADAHGLDALRDSLTTTLDAARAAEAEAETRSVVPSRAAGRRTPQMEAP